MRYKIQDSTTMSIYPTQLKIDILNPTGKIIDALKTLNLPAGVDIKIKAA